MGRDATASPTQPRPAQTRTDGELLEANRRFYDPLWTDARLVEPQRFNTWPLVSALAATRPRRLEVAPGLRPRLPIEGTHFVDFSRPAVAKLQSRGANAVLGLISALPFAARSFDLVCAVDVVEHVDEEDRAFAELARVAAADAVLLLSVPLHPSMWTPFDDFVGHCRRYEPERLLAKLSEHGFAIEQSAAYGMRPKSSRLVDYGMAQLATHRERAMWWYNHVLMPLGVRFQKKLTFTPGLVDTTDVGEVLVVCRKV
jgi:SAM-dependent methyltransferase